MITAQNRSINELLAWVYSRKMLTDHITNGAARGLYPGVVAEMTIHQLEGMEDAIRSAIVQIATKEQ